MTEKDESDPAFPVTLQNVSRGMTLRDWLAGQAIVGILANPDISASASRVRVSTEDFRTDTARTAYQMADALLLARSKQ